MKYRGYVICKCGKGYVPGVTKRVGTYTVTVAIDRG